MPYQDSPGWERQWKNFAWDWDFHVSTVSEGHRCVVEKDKTDAKSKGAKLTFGEVLDCGVARMLHNLGAAHKTSFHDLGMGPGKMLIQTYLQYNNFRRCMGVELAKGRYDLGERNIRTLLTAGWRGRKFLGIEFKKGEYFKIVEDVPDKAPKEGWKVGDRVIAYNPLLKTDKMVHKDYTGEITEIQQHPSGDDKKTLYTVKYSDGTTCDRIQLRYLFLPGKERTCEVWYGSLFDYPGGFDADICVLETDFPEDMHPHLIECMCTTPIGCTFLTYHDLKKFKCYDWDNLRQIDCNVYDNDRYITSWSQGWRFYLWEHVHNYAKALPYDTEPNGAALLAALKQDDQIVFKDNRDKDSPLQYGEILTISKDDEKSEETNLIVKTNKLEVKKVHYENVTLSSSDYTIYKTRHRFRIGQDVSAYFPENLKDSEYHNRFHLLKAKVMAVNASSLSYTLHYTEEQTTRRDMSERYVYNPPKLLFKVGDKVMSCWPRNAQNKNCPHRYKRFPAQVIGINNDATYRLHFDTSSYLLSLLRPTTYPEDYHPSEDNKKQAAYAPTVDHPVAEAVREMWVQYPAQFKVQEVTRMEQKIGTPFYMQFNAAFVESWNNQHVVQWLSDIGFEEKGYLSTLCVLNAVDGAALLKLKAENEKDLAQELSALLVKRSEENENEQELKLNRVELRNLLSNIRYLQEQNKAMKQNQSPYDNAKVQQLWANLKKQMAPENYADTDTK